MEMYITEYGKFNRKFPPLLKYFRVTFEELSQKKLNMYNRQSIEN